MIGRPDRDSAPALQAVALYRKLESFEKEYALPTINQLVRQGRRSVPKKSKNAALLQNRMQARSKYGAKRPKAK